MPDALAKKGRKWLRELYEASTLTGKARGRAAKSAKSGFFGGDKDLTGPIGALAALDQEGLEHLVTEGSMTVPQERLPPALVGTKVPGNVGTLTFTPSPDEKGAFVMTVDTAPRHQSSQLGIVIDPLNVMGTPGVSPNMLKEKPSDAPIDLTPYSRADSKETITTLPDWLGRIAKATSASIYCEYFPTNDGRPLTRNLAKKASLSALLNGVARAFGYAVVQHGDSYFLWSRSWFLDRPNTVPGEIVRRFRAASSAGHSYQLEDFLAGATMNRPQWQMMERLEAQYGRSFIYPADSRLLTFLSHLTPKQRETAATTTGLATAAFPPDLLNELDSLTKPQS